MNIPLIKSYDDLCVDIVVHVINDAKAKLGHRQNLIQLAQSRITGGYGPAAKLSVHAITCPLALNCEKFIIETISKKWRLNEVFRFIVRYMGTSQDECSMYFYFEARFCQPTVSYPVPQANVSVYFRVEDKHMESPEMGGVPHMIFRLEGQHSNHDVRFVTLTADWLLEILQTKLKMYKKIEAFGRF